MADVFRMLVFLIAVPNLLLISKLGILCLNSGDLTQGLPFLAICLMCCSYLVKGVSETISYVKGRIR